VAGAAVGVAPQAARNIDAVTARPTKRYAVFMRFYSLMNERH
jgi:hypothetical protein